MVCWHGVGFFLQVLTASKLFVMHSRRTVLIFYHGRNQFATTCGGPVRRDGNPQVLKEKWLSVLHHTVNSHSWGGSDFFSECAHPPLPQDRSDRTCWLQPDTPSHNALKRIVHDEHLSSRPDDWLQSYW